MSVDQPTSDMARPRPPLGQWVTGRIGYANAYAIAVYLATRVAIAFGVLAAYLFNPRLSWHGIATRLDALWYQHIAQWGYGHNIHPTHIAAVHRHLSSWAFYPGYPLAIRIVHLVTRLPYVAASVVVATIMGAVAVRAAYALGDALGGLQVGRGTATLVAAWPGSVAMNLPYSEGLFVATAAASLAALLRRRWWTAGLFGFVATMTRAVGLALVVAALVAAATEIRRDRSWRPLAAPVVSAAGVGGFLLFGWQQTGDPFVWRRAEDLWHQSFDFGAAMFHKIAHDLPHRGLKADAALLDICGLLMLVGFVVAAIALGRRARLPLVAYTLVALVLLLGYGNVGSRPRMVLAVVPGFAWLARWLRPRSVDILALGLASTLALVAFLYVNPMRV